MKDVWGKKGFEESETHVLCPVHFLSSHTVYERNTQEIMYWNCYPMYIL